MKPLEIVCEPPGVMHPDDGIAIVKVRFRNPAGKPASVSGLKLQHVTMGEMPAVAVPEKFRAEPGPAWLDPAGFTLEAGGEAYGRLGFAIKKIVVSLPCALEARSSLGQSGRGGILCVPLKDLQDAARKAAEKKAKAEKTG